MSVLLAADFAVSALWVVSGAGVAAVGGGDAVKWALSIAVMFLFAWLSRLTRGGSYNPLTVLYPAISGSFGGFLVVVLGRVPAQVLGSIVGVKLIMRTFPKVGRGPRLNVDIHQGALTEGLLTFVIVMISLGLRKKHPKSFFMKTWISSIMKLSLHILGSDLTGGCMNPAKAAAWAYARGDHKTKEHLYVYWLAPLEATILAVWTFSLFTQPEKYKRAEDGEETWKDKSE